MIEAYVHKRSYRDNAIDLNLRLDFSRTDTFIIELITDLLKNNNYVQCERVKIF